MSELIENSTELAPLQAQVPQVMSMLSKMVDSKHINLEAMDKLIDMQMKVMTHQAKMDYTAAMVKFNSVKQPIKTNRTGKTAGNAPFSYADFPELVKNVSPWLARCGLSFSHRQDAPTLVEGMVKLIMVHCDIKHVSGHCESYTFPAIPDEKLRGHLSPSQLIQLALTYAKRQTLCLALGIAASEDKNDDDSTKSEKKITEKQAADLTALMDETIKNKPAFMKWLKVDNLSELPEKMYDKAIVECEKKRK